MSLRGLDRQDTAGSRPPQLRVTIPSPVRYRTSWPPDSGDDGSPGGVRRGQRTRTTGDRKAINTTDGEDRQEERERQLHRNSSDSRSPRAAHVPTLAKSTRTHQTQRNTMLPNVTVEETKLITEHPESIDSSDTEHEEARKETANAEDGTVGKEQWSRREQWEKEDDQVTKIKEKDVRAYLEAEIPAHSPTDHLARHILAIERWKQEELSNFQEWKEEIAIQEEALRRREQDLDTRHNDVEQRRVGVQEAREELSKKERDLEHRYKDVGKRRADIKAAQEDLDARECLVYSLENVLEKVRTDDSDIA